MKKVFDTIDTLNSAYISVWQELCNIESPTEYKKGVDAAGEYCIAFAKAHNWKVEVEKQPVAGDVVCITMNADSNAAPITVSGHLDTVHPVGSFGNTPVIMDDTNIYGPGVMDCKGGIVAALLAMDALERCGFEGRPIQLLLQTDEEDNSTSSGKETIKYMCRKAENSVAFLNLEGIRASSMVLERKGIIRYRFAISGKGIHSSRCATEGASAIAEAARMLLRLEELKDEDGLTCNCGLISGGTAANTVPDACSFVADIRFRAAEELKWVKGHVKEIAENTENEDCTCRITEVSYRPAMEKTERNLALAARINEIYTENGLPFAEVRKSLGGSDAADVTEYGIPCVDAIGVDGGLIHTPREFARLASLAEAAKRIAAICSSI